MRGNEPTSMGERRQPQYELERVRLATAFDVMHSPAPIDVRRHFESIRNPLSMVRAKEHVVSMLQNLAPGELVETKRLESDLEGYVLAIGSRLHGETRSNPSQAASAVRPP